jgi:hypothetical protein
MPLEMRRVRAVPPGILAAALAGALLACADSGLEARLADYAGRVRLAVGAPGEAAAPASTRLPRRRERALAVEDRRIGMLDFLALQGCALGELAGYRNSPLGRVMPPTRRLVYELEVLEAGETCLGESDGERGERLRSLLDAKRGDLPLHVWNALWSGPELEGFLSLRGEPGLGLPDEDAQASLGEIQRRLEREVIRSEDAVAIEAALGRLRDEPPLGASLHRMAAARHHLEEVAAWLELEPAGPCRGRAVTLARAFREGYLPLQPDLARLDQSVAETLPTLEAIHRRVAGRVTPPDPMAAYGRAWLGTEQADGLRSGYRAAVLRHAAAWEPVLRACGVLPGSAPS